MDKYLKAALSQKQAEARHALFTPSKDINYNLFLKCPKGETFEGHLVATFDLQKVSSDFFFDYAGTNIQEIVVNGSKLDTSDSYESIRDRRFLQIPPQSLKQGPNEIRIKYSNLYANDGNGLHSFVDTDEKQYLYSQAETYAANKIFPCFDQPDIKAKLTLTMAVPNDWVAVSNQSANEENLKRVNLADFLNTEEQSNFRVYAFSSTPRLPTYLFVFIAGPYTEIKSEKVHNNIAMSCYCRESLAEHLKNQAEEVFEITRECLKFYEGYFNYPYPFEKYDSVWCPEYNAGAMEHPGAVTFNDEYVWREPVTADDNTNRANTISHEAAHHWFGDLVTMKWWNDLWLNESFADYISHYCLEKIKNKVTTTKFSDIWLSFFNGKGWGYRADQQRTTHPIAGEVLNTDHAETIFDGITYSKGAASLKQLMCLIGEENFGKAMSSYFKKYEWSNATLTDFIASLQQYYKPSFPGSPDNLEHWKSEWLQTAGLNECLPLFNPSENSAQAKLVIRQTAALEAFPTLRHHKMKIAFFDENAKVYETKDIVLENTPETTITYDGSKQPKAVMLNYQDEAFIKIRLDEHSIAFFKSKIHLIPDELTRAMIWRSLFDMARDGKLSAYKFIEVVVGGAPDEPEDSALSNILRYASASLSFSPKVLNDNVLKPRLFECVLKILKSTDKGNTNRIVLLRDYVIGFASYGEERKVDNMCRLLGWLNGTDADLKDIETDVPNKWDIVKMLHRYPAFSDAQKIEVFNKVKEVDQSDRLKQAEQQCEALRADENQRAKLRESYLDPENKTSTQLLGESMDGYSGSLRFTESDVEFFFDNVLKVFETRNNEFAQTFYHSLFPTKENISHYIERVQELLSKVSNNDWLLKSLRESLDDLERKKRGYTCSAPELLKEFFNISI